MKFVGEKKIGEFFYPNLFVIFCGEKQTLNETKEEREREKEREREVLLPLLHL